MVKIGVWNIDWNADDEIIEDLPSEEIIELTDEDLEDYYDEETGEWWDYDGLIADELSDRYGWCVNSFYKEIID